jgi:hypothetical protein
MSGTWCWTMHRICDTKKPADNKDRLKVCCSDISASVHNLSAPLLEDQGTRAPLATLYLAQVLLRIAIPPTILRWCMQELEPCQWITG